MESDLAFMDAQLEALPAEVVADPVAVVDPVVPAEPPAAEPDVAVDPVAPVEGEVTTEPEVDENFEDQLEDLSITALNKKLEANPALKEALEKDPSTKNIVFTALRRAAKLDQYEGIFTNPETAKFTLETANQMVEFDRTFRSTDPKDSEQFLSSLQFNSFQRDELGNVITDAAGNPQSTGAYERVMGTYRSFLWDAIDKKATATDDPELAEAVKIIREKIEGQTAGAQPAAKEDRSTLPADVQARLKRLDDLERVNTESERSTVQTFATNVNTDITTKLTAEVNALITNITKRDNVAISDYVKKNIVRDAVESVRKNVGENQAYKNMLSTLMQSTARNAEGQAKIVKFAISSIKQTLPKIVAATISNATKSVVADATTRQTKINTQAQRQEPRTTGGVARSQALPDIKSVIAEATQKAKAEGKTLSEYDIAELAMNMK